MVYLILRMQSILFVIQKTVLCTLNYTFYNGGSRGGTGGPDPPPLKNHKNIGFPCNAGPDPLINHKATKPAFNDGPSSACQRSAIYMAFRWLANVGPFIAVFGSSIPSSTSKKIKFGPPLTKFSGSAHVLLYAHDTVVLAESKEQLQAALISMYLRFCFQV